MLSPCVQYNIRRDAVLLNESSDDGLQLNIFKSALFFVILVKHFSSRSRNHLPLVMNLAVLPAVYARCSLMMNLSTNSCPLISWAVFSLPHIFVQCISSTCKFSVTHCLYWALIHKRENLNEKAWLHKSYSGTNCFYIVVPWVPVMKTAPSLGL